VVCPSSISLSGRGSDPTFRSRQFCARSSLYCNAMLKYSVVVPLLNEEQSVSELYSRLTVVMERLGEPFEEIFVDDGSTDCTFQVLERIASLDTRVTVLKLRHHSGKTVALAAGFERAKGDYIVSMDGDLQHD